MGAATPVSAGGDIDILAAGDLTVTNLAATTGDIRLTQTGAGALNIANAISAGGDVSLAAAGDVNIDNGNINSNAPVTAVNDISVTAGGAVNIREPFSAGGTALFDADGDILLVGLSSAVIDAETTIDAGGDIRYDGLISIRRPMTLIAAGSIFRVDAGVFGNSFSTSTGFTPVLTVQAGGDIGLSGDPFCQHHPRHHADGRQHFSSYGGRRAAEWRHGGGRLLLSKHTAGWPRIARSNRYFRGCYRRRRHPV